jgi:flagellar protein FlgJ
VVSSERTTETTTREDPRLRDEQRAFVTRMWDHAAAAQQATGIPARFVLGQAALESGWGKREIRDSSGFPTYNLFGIKAGSGWQGKTVDVVTTEYENGVAKKVVEKFRAYNNYSEAFRDWAQLIAGNKRYAEVVESGRAGGNAAGFANGLARAGYATDPEYGAKLVRVIGSIGGTRAGTG